MKQESKAKEIIFQADPQAAAESRCFFCYGTFLNQEKIAQIEEKIFHLNCLKDMLVSNEVTHLTLITLENTEQIIDGFKLKYPHPAKT